MKRIKRAFFIAWAWILVQILEYYLHWVPLADCQTQEIIDLINEYHRKVGTPANG